MTARFLEERGVEVVYGATHAKGFCIDNRFVLLGSTNLTQQSVTKNNETNLLFDDEETRRTAKRLLEAGITDLHYGPTHLFSHSKWLVQDRRTIALGTGNWLNEDITIHPQLYVKWESPALARELLGWLKVKIKRTGTPLSGWRGPA